jgi:hypothetical protein
MWAARAALFDDGTADLIEKGSIHVRVPWNAVRLRWFENVRCLACRRNRRRGVHRRIAAARHVTRR